MPAYLELLLQWGICLSLPLVQMQKQAGCQSPDQDTWKKLPCVLVSFISPMLPGQGALAHYSRSFLISSGAGSLHMVTPFHLRLNALWLWSSTWASQCRCLGADPALGRASPHVFQEPTAFLGSGFLLPPVAFDSSGPE